jgi:hypothetical protein
VEPSGVESGGDKAAPAYHAAASPASRPMGRAHLPMARACQHRLGVRSMAVTPDCAGGAWLSYSWSSRSCSTVAAAKSCLVDGLVSCTSVIA